MSDFGPSESPSPAVPVSPESGASQVPPRNKGGGSKKGSKKRQPNELLRDMRWAYKHPRKEDEDLKLTPGQQQCRDLQEKDQVEFLKMLRDLEKAHLMAGRRQNAGSPSGASEGSSAGSAGTTDKGEATVQELIDELLKGWTVPNSGSK